MIRRTSTLAAGLLFLSASLPWCSADAQQAPLQPANNVHKACVEIEKAVSKASQVFYPPHVQFAADSKHYFASSDEFPACTVEPGNPKDVGAILRIVGSLRTPFAVKGGGHNTNLGFSSTQGVQISMARFNKMHLRDHSTAVDVGSGLLWDDVYKFLDGKGVNVVGGRVQGVGVAGFTLGGGYSWKSSQYGLTLDNVLEYELVLPDGTIKTVTQEDEDLWFGLRGGNNNFGIVTRFTFKTHPQGDIWGGYIIIGADQVDKLSEAIGDFQANVTDKKAMILPTFNAFMGQVGLGSIFLTLLFYDGPTPPAGVFDKFLSIPTYAQNLTTDSFWKVFEGIPYENPYAGTRAAYNSVSFSTYGPKLLNALYNETFHWAEKLTPLDAGVAVVYSVQVFDKDLLTYGAPSAYPPDRSGLRLPTNVYFGWTNPELDTVFADALRQSAAVLRAVAAEEGQVMDNVAIYGNYALSDEPLEGVYGANVPRLREIKKRYDPDNVMGLAGGFKF
ncbi:FAD-binding domain-containing protein [Gloeopeniophorella convolvens]|nr:FAD-binding domain-containing protein [Gloeopeniophorella convolvens]